MALERSRQLGAKPATARSSAIMALALCLEVLEREQKTAAVAAERCAVTKQSLIEDLRGARKAALEAGQISAYVNATKEIAILAGLRIERMERGSPGEFDWVEKLSVEELQALADGKVDLASLRPDGDADGHAVN